MNDASPPAPRQRTLLLAGRLHDAEDDHDAEIRAMRAGTTPETLARDLQLWRALGASIVELAGRVRRHCAESRFCDARPDLGPLVARLVDAIDDQIDAAAWRVVSAQARLLAARGGK